MAGDGRWSLSDENESSDINNEAMLLETEKTTEADDEHLNSSPNPGYSSALFSHWSGSWSKPSEFCTNAEEPPSSLLPGDNITDDPAPESAQVMVEFSPASSLLNSAIIGSGLSNLGNTCFLNAVLQCFIHTVPLIQPILSNWNLAHSINNCDKERFCLLCAFRDLIQRSLVLNSTVSPWGLVDNLTHISSNFRRYQQEDAHEFLQCFLDRLESCHEPESNNCKSSQSDNIVQQVFGGRLVSNLKCCNCDHCSDTYEPSIDLSLEIDDADNLFTALHSFTKVERIEDPENKFTCEKCNERVFVEKKLSFDQAPSVAVLHLKRFKNDGSSVEKIDKHVAFPLDLNLEPFTKSGKHNYAELQYVLYAVVVHIGFRPTSGHYYCFIRLSSDMWCKFDDSKVELVHEDYVLAQEAYVLFYAKQSTPWFSSFMETQKDFVNSTIWNTSPKSVLEDVDTSSVSPRLENKFGFIPNEVSNAIGSAHEGGNDNAIKDSGSVQKETKRKVRVHDLLASVASYSTSNKSLPKDKKVSPEIVLEKISHNQNVSVVQNDRVLPRGSPSRNSKIDIDAAFRSPSPEIYREDSPDVGFTICRSHLRSVDRIPCKRKLVEDMDDEVKQARSFVRKNMSGSRSEQLLAVLRGSKSEPPLNRKKSRRLNVK